MRDQTPTLEDRAATSRAARDLIGVPEPDPRIGNLGSTSHLTAVPLLTAEEEVHLARLAEAGAVAREALDTGRHVGERSRGDLETVAAAGQLALEHLELANLRLVAWCARQRVAAGCSVDYSDLFQEGVLGLRRAVHKWDYRKGLKFSTYAVPWIREKQASAVRRVRGISTAVDEQQQAIRRARAALIVELERAPTEEEVSERVGLSAARIAELEALGRLPAASLDQPLRADSSTTLGDRIGDPDIDADAWLAMFDSDTTGTNAETIVGTSDNDGTVTDEYSPSYAAVADHDEQGALRRALAALPDREQRVLTMHFGLDGEPEVGIAEIARTCGVPRRLAQRTLDKALTHVRAELTAAG